MNPVDGGVVEEVETWRSQDRRRLVSGVWTGGRFAPGSSVLIQQFRAGDLVGLWRVSGAAVQTPSQITHVVGPETTALELTPRASEHGPEIRRGDVLVFGEGRSVTFSATAPLAAARPLALHTPGHEHHAILLPGGGRNLVVFFRDIESLPAENPTIFLHRGRRLDLAIAEFERLATANLEVVFEPARVALGRLTSILPVVRDFLLDAGDELLFQNTRAERGGRRHEVTYSLFEPQFEAQPGSIRLILTPPQRDRIPLGALPDDVLKLFFDAMRLASAGEPRALVELLSSHVFSVKTQLSRLEKIARSAALNGDFLLRSSTHPDGVRVNTATLTTLKDAQIASTPRLLERIGLLYAMDSLRFWCRILTESGEDWTLRYEPRQGDQVTSVFQKRAAVTFMTSSTMEKPGGHGALITVRTA